MKMLKKGDSGEEVKQLQKALGIPADGIFGEQTKQAVIKYQLMHELTVDGVVGNGTWSVLLTKGASYEAIDQDTDSSEQYFTTPYNQIIHRYFLPEHEYIREKVKPEYMMLHHTAGGANPYSVIDMWGRDDRGRIATEFVLGGQDHKTGSNKYDGVMVQAFPQGYYGWHIGKSGSGSMNKKTVGIEICSMGHLDSEKKTYVGSKCTDSQVIQIPEAFRGKINFHKYSDKQIEEVDKWIRYIAERDNIDVRVGLQQWIKKYGPTKAFDYQEDAFYGKVKGLLSHTNVRKDKMDVYPDPRLVDVIMSL
jgi:hypothetical protein